LGRAGFGGVDPVELGVHSEATARPVDGGDLVGHRGAGRFQAGGVGSQDHGAGAQGTKIGASDHHEPPETTWLEPLDDLTAEEGDCSWVVVVVLEAELEDCEAEEDSDDDSVLGVVVAVAAAWAVLWPEKARAATAETAPGRARPP